jgi:isoquinoline 1-oxidoreductase alpha subunit
MPSFQLRVNGRRQTVDADADTPLLWILRDVLGLTGTKFGCGAGICGACTVHQDGAAVRSCQIAVADANGKSYTTIEGLGCGGLHPCQRAWLDEDVAQCGYCQPGMIMEAAALLRTHANPTVAQIEDAMDGHVCRCGTYPRILAAVRRASRS